MTTEWSDDDGEEVSEGYGVRDEDSEIAWWNDDDENFLNFLNFFDDFGNDLEEIWSSEGKEDLSYFQLFQYDNCKPAFVESIFSGRGGPLIRIFQWRQYVTAFNLIPINEWKFRFLFLKLQVHFQFVIVQ